MATQQKCKTSGSMRSYTSNTKESWRNWAWNVVAQHARKDGPVLYLAGPEDNDRAAAIVRGFSHHLLIGVDRDGGNVAKVKSRGGLAIQGNLEDVLHSWPSSWPVAAIVADFCCGLTSSVRAFSASLANPALSGSVVVVNLLRGRDPIDSDEAMLMTELVGDDKQVFRKMQEGYDAQLRRSRSLLKRMRSMVKKLRHRGLLQRARAVELAKNRLRNTLSRFDVAADSVRDFRSAYNTMDIKSRAVRFYALLRLENAFPCPLDAPYAYKSATQYFDSLVFRNDSGERQFNPGSGDEALRLTVIAVKAHSTRRANVLPPFIC